MKKISFLLLTFLSAKMFAVRTPINPESPCFKFLKAAVDGIVRSSEIKEDQRLKCEEFLRSIAEAAKKEDRSKETNKNTQRFFHS